MLFRKTYIVLIAALLGAGMVYAQEFPADSVQVQEPLVESFDVREPAVESAQVQGDSIEPTHSQESSVDSTPAEEPAIESVDTPESVAEPVPSQEQLSDEPRAEVISKQNPAETVHAQEPTVEPRIAGLDGNEEYMRLIREDAQLQVREDSVVNAVERTRTLLRENPANRQQYSQEILRMENRIFEIRSAKGRLVDRINTIEQEWVLANLNTPAVQPVQQRPAAEIPDSLKVRNLVYNPYFAEQLPGTDYAALRKAQQMEFEVVDYVNSYFANYAVASQLAEAYAAAQTEAEATDIYDKYNAMQGFNRILADSLSGAWNYIFDNKSYAYGYLMDMLEQDDLLAREEQRQSEALRELSALSGRTASDAVSDYFLRKKVLVGYEAAVADVLHLTAARDSLRGVAVQLDAIDFRLPRLDVAERYFLDYDSIVYSPTPHYTTQNPIPEAKIHEHGTIYRILLGAFSSKRPVSTFRGVYPLSYLVDEDKKWNYYAGGFATREEADAAQKQMKARGFMRPEVVVWIDGQYKNFSRDPQAQLMAYRVEINTSEALSDEVKTVIADTAEGRELSRVGHQLFVVGMFDDKADADRLADAIRQTDPVLEIKVAEISD